MPFASLIGYFNFFDKYQDAMGGSAASELRWLRLEYDNRTSLLCSVNSRLKPTAKALERLRKDFLEEIEQRIKSNEKRMPG